MEDYQEHLHSYYQNSYEFGEGNNENSCLLAEDSEQESGPAGVKVITIKVLRCGRSNQVDQELLEDFDLTPILKGDSFQLQHLLQCVAEEMNINAQGQQVLLFNEIGQLFVNFGTFPSLVSNAITLREFTCSNILILKLKKSPWSLLHQEMSRDIAPSLMDGPPKLIEGPQTGNGQKLVRKESCVKNFQKIGYIVKKILSLKTSKMGQRASFDFKNDRKLTKKSVEDYFYQVRQGHKHNFDFNENCHENMRLLREFVKQHDDGAKKSKKTMERASTQQEQSNTMSVP